MSIRCGDPCGIESFIVDKLPLQTSRSSAITRSFWTQSSHAALDLSLIVLARFNVVHGAHVSVSYRSSRNEAHCSISTVGAGCLILMQELGEDLDGLVNPDGSVRGWAVSHRRSGNHDLVMARAAHLVSLT